MKLKNNLNDRFLLQLSLIDGVGPGAAKVILNSGLSCEEASLLSVRDLEHLGLGTVAHKIYLGLRNTELLEKELLLIDRLGVSWGSNYPDLLKEIHLPPLILYWKGSLEGNKIAFVGSRQGNGYGLKVIKKLLPVLIERGFVIVSGGAIGIDSMAHREAIGLGGRTIVILGSGLLNPYPYRNKELFSEIVDKGGALVSSFPLSMDVRPGNFPARNRIISGVSLGCVVVQAAKRSGANITASFALEQGREVFAVPGDISDELSEGCHCLIQQGAKLVNSAQDILDELL